MILVALRLDAVTQYQHTDESYRIPVAAFITSDGNNLADFARCHLPDAAAGAGERQLLLGDASGVESRDIPQRPHRALHDRQRQQRAGPFPQPQIQVNQRAQAEMLHAG
jgi:hypothetical protein